MKTDTQKVLPEEFILSVLSPEQRLDAVLRLSSEAFQKTKLTLKGIETAVKKIRKKVYDKKKNSY